MRITTDILNWCFHLSNDFLIIYRQTPNIGHLVTSVKIGQSSGAYFHANDQNVRCIRSIPELPWPSISALGRNHTCWAAPSTYGAIQHGQENICLHFVHKIWGYWSELDRCWHGHILRQWLESNHGCPSSRSLSSYRTNKRCSHLQVKKIHIFYNLL